jgi:hypothetical protein
MNNYFNNVIGLPFDGFKDRIFKQKQLEREMVKKHKLNKNNYRITFDENCIIFEYIDNSKLYY